MDYLYDEDLCAECHNLNAAECRGLCDPDDYEEWDD